MTSPPCPAVPKDTATRLARYLVKQPEAVMDALASPLQARGSGSHKGKPRATRNTRILGIAR